MAEHVHERELVRARVRAVLGLVRGGDHAVARGDDLRLGHSGDTSMRSMRWPHASHCTSTGSLCDPRAVCRSARPRRRRTRAARRRRGGTNRAIHDGSIGSSSNWFASCGGSWKNAMAGTYRAIVAA
jgi:hypothetical protein